MRTALAVIAMVMGCDGAARFGDSGTTVEAPPSDTPLVCLDARNPLVGDEPAWSAPDEDGELAAVSFRLAIDPTHPSLDSEGFQPKTQAVTIAGATRGWDIGLGPPLRKTQTYTLRLSEAP